jgi:hypothetical protein
MDLESLIRDRTIFDDLCNDHHDDPSPPYLALSSTRITAR